MYIIIIISFTINAKILILITLKRNHIHSLLVLIIGAQMHNNFTCVLFTHYGNAN